MFVATYPIVNIHKTRDDVEMEVLLLLVNANPRRRRFQGFIPVLAEWNVSVSQEG